MTARFWGAIVGICGLLGSTPAATQPGSSGLPMDRVYQGPYRLPDFTGRDRDYATFRTKIVKEMSTGPNFAGHFTIVEIGCGTGCRFVYTADIASGKIYHFPYGGEEYDMLSLSYAVKSNLVHATWRAGNICYQDDLEWDGKEFASSGKRVAGDRSACD